MKKINYGLWVIVLLFGYLSLLLLQTYWPFLVFALLLAVVFYPLYVRLEDRVHRITAALAVVIIVLVALVVPTLWIIASTLQQAQPAYQGALNLLDNPTVREQFGVTAEQLRAVAATAGEKLRENVLDNASAYLAKVSDLLIGLFILFITLFFLLLDGKRLYHLLIEELPFSRSQGEQFFAQMRKIIRAVLLGQLVTAAVQGVLAYVLLLVFGIPNALFWGVIVTLLSVIPVLGPFLVYLPATGYLFLQGRYVEATIMLILGIVILSQVDNVIRPYIASKTTRIHPLIVILGVIGGLKLWGLVGFILGPLVLAAFFALYDFAVTGEDEKKPRRA